MARTIRASRSARLNNLARLLQDTNRLGEAEPVMRRALAIDEASYGQNHPNVAAGPVLCSIRHRELFGAVCYRSYILLGLRA
jgi:hypothetical protein